MLIQICIEPGYQGIEKARTRWMPGRVHRYCLESFYKLRDQPCWSIFIHQGLLAIPVRKPSITSPVTPYKDSILGYGLAISLVRA